MIVCLCYTFPMKIISLLCFYISIVNSLVFWLKLSQFHSTSIHWCPRYWCSLFISSFIVLIFFSCSFFLCSIISLQLQIFFFSLDGNFKTAVSLYLVYPCGTPGKIQKWFNIAFSTHYEMMPLPLLWWLKFSSAFSIFLYHCCQILAPAEFNWRARMISIHLVTLLRWYIICSCPLGKLPPTQPWSNSTPVLEGVKLFDATLFPDHLTPSFKN